LEVGLLLVGMRATATPGGTSRSSVEIVRELGKASAGSRVECLGDALKKSVALECEWRA
jgi:hypothetical protein